MILRRKLLKAGLTGLAASVATPFVGRTGWAAAPTALKLAFADTQSHPLYEVLKRFSDDVSKRTSEAIDIQVFSIGQLGSGTNILTGLQTGIIDFCAHTSGFIDPIFPKFQVLDLPFLFPDSASAEKLLDGPTGTKFMDMLPTKGIPLPFISAGGLVSYGPDTIDPYRRAASYVDRILRGAKPADLPVQLPTKFEMVVNLKSAKALGLIVPRFILLRADEVIE